MKDRLMVLNYQTLEGGGTDDMTVAMSEARRLTMRGIVLRHLPYSETAVSDNGRLEYSMAMEVTLDGKDPKQIRKE